MATVRLNQLGTLLLLVLCGCGGGGGGRAPERARAAAPPAAVTPAGLAPMPPMPPAAAAPAPAAPRPSCAVVDPDALWSLVPPAELDGLAAAARRVVQAELDGAAPTEVVLAVDAREEYTDGEDVSRIWVLACEADTWSIAGSAHFDIDESWAGYYDDPLPGIAVLRAETVPGVTHPFLRVEHIDMRGGADPRYMSRKFHLLHLVQGELVTAFTCETTSEIVQGPDRETTSERLRVVTYAGGTRATIRVRATATDRDGGRRNLGSSAYVFDGREFVAPRDVCGL